MLRDIMNVSTEMIVPPCYLKRSSNDGEKEWTPVACKMTPMSDSIGMAVDSEACITPTA